MDDRYFSDFNLPHEEVYLELKKVKSRNYHLSRKLEEQERVSKGQSKLIAELRRENKALRRNR